MMEHTALEYFKNLVYVSIISADNDEFGLTEEDKQEIIRRRELFKDDWEMIFQPIKDEKQRNLLIDMFRE